MQSQGNAKTLFQVFEPKALKQRGTGDAIATLRFPLSITSEADITVYTATDSNATLTSGNSARPLGNSPGAGELCRIVGCVPQLCQFSAECLSEPLTFCCGQGVPRLCDRIEFLQHRIEFSPQRWLCGHF